MDIQAFTLTFNVPFYVSVLCYGIAQIFYSEAIMSCTCLLFVTMCGWRNMQCRATATPLGGGLCEFGYYGL